eukprot:12991798-Alexandrium_andersonii.AAC.1
MFAVSPVLPRGSCLAAVLVRGGRGCGLWASLGCRPRAWQPQPRLRAARGYGARGGEVPPAARSAVPSWVGSLGRPLARLL